MSIQQYYKNHKANQPTHVYYNMNLLNNDGSFPAQPVRFQYKETRSNDFLLSPQDYYMSIVRFNLQTPSLPVFIPQININPNTNVGGTYAIQSMAGVNTTTPFTITLFTNQNFPVDSVVYLAYNAYNPTVAPAGDTSSTGLQYFRVTNVSRVVGANTVLTLENTSGTTIGVPNNYPNNTGGLKGSTQVLEMAEIPVSTLVYSPITKNLLVKCLGLTSLPPGTLSSLTDVYKPNDTIYIVNSGLFNGIYKINSLSTTTITINAPQFDKYWNFVGGTWYDANMPVYVSGGLLVSNNDFVNVTPYTITMTYIPPTAPTVNLSVTLPIIYQPTVGGTTPPIWNPSQAQALSLQDLTSEYYFVYSYPNWITMVNQCMTSCFWLLQGQFWNGGAGFANGQYLPNVNVNTNQFQPPSMTWNSDQLKAIITGSYILFSQNNTNTAFVYFNNPLSTLFDSFPYLYPDVGYDSPLYSELVFNTNAGAGIYIVQSYNTDGTPVSPNGVYTGIQIYQDHQTASLMNPVQSILFTSTLLPVVNENVGLPLIINGTSSTQTVIGSSANIFPVVTDFIVPFSATNGYVPDVTYVPSGEYRLVDLYGTSPCKSIDVQVFWKDSYGENHPFYLGSGCSGSLKIMFRAKDYNNKDLS